MAKFNESMMKKFRIMSTEVAIVRWRIAPEEWEYCEWHGESDDRVSMTRELGEQISASNKHALFQARWADGQDYEVWTFDKKVFDELVRQFTQVHIPAQRTMSVSVSWWRRFLRLAV